MHTMCHHSGSQVTAVGLGETSVDGRKSLHALLWDVSRVHEPSEFRNETGKPSLVCCTQCNRREFASFRRKPSVWNACLVRIFTIDLLINENARISPSVFRSKTVEIKKNIFVKKNKKIMISMIMYKGSVT